MTIGCIILAHREPGQLALLLSKLVHPQIRVYLHIDRRAPLKPFVDACAAAQISNTNLLRRRRTLWGGVEFVDVALDGLARGMADGCQYFVLISGQDFPVRPIEELVAFAEQAAGRSFIEHFALPTSQWRYGGRLRTEFYSYNILGRRETCIPKGEDVTALSFKGRVLNSALRVPSAMRSARRFPRDIRPFGGSSWWNLSQPAAKHVLQFVDERPDYRRYHKHTLSADELFFQSILLGTSFAGEEEVINDALRFMIWPEGASHPRLLTTDDVPAMLSSGTLFARKFDMAADPAPLVALAERVAE